MKMNYSIPGLAGAFLILFGSVLAGRAQTELIINGGFESGTASSPTGWTVGGGAEAYLYPSVAHSGSRFLFLGGIENEVDYAYQTIAIPSGAGSARLSFYYNITSNDDPDTPYDFFMATIRDTSGTVLSGVGDWSNADQDPGAGNPYYHLVSFDLLAYAGQTIRVQFNSGNDSTLQTSFLVDDVSVQVSASSGPLTNDLCSGAISMVAGATYNVNTGTATSTGDPTPSCQPNFGKGVWFKFTPSTSGSVTISTCGSGFDTMLAVFTGSCGSLTPFACDDDNGPACAGNTASVSFAGSAGTTYYVLAGGYGGASGNLSILATGPPPPAPTLIPEPNRVDMVYDAPRDILYITSGTNVLRYQLGSDSFLTPFRLSGNLMGIDLSPDGNTLMVADSSANSNVWVHIIDLTSGQSHKVFFPASFYESGTFAVAFGGDGAALITSRFAGSGFVPLRRYDPATGLTSIIANSVDQDSMVSASGDGTTIVIALSDNSGGPLNRYDVASRTIAKSGGTGWYNYECAASRDASLFAIPTYGSTFIYNTNFTQITNIGVYAGAQPIGAAFHPSADVVFFPFAGTTYVKAYSTADWSLLAQFDFGYAFSTPGNHAFNNGRIRISPDGQIIFVTVGGGVRYLRHNLTLPLTHRLLVAGSPASYGAPTPLPYGAYWLPDGTNLTVSVPSFVMTNAAEVVCTGWNGSGSVASGGISNAVSFTLTNNSTLTWNWTPFAVSMIVQSQPGGKQILLQWPSVPGASYDVLWATNVLGPFGTLTTGLPGAPPYNSYQTPIGGAGAGFYKVNMR